MWNQTEPTCRKVLKRFLEDENGPVESLEIRCLKPKTRSGTVVLEDTHESLPDIGLFNVISGPLEVILVKGNKYDVLLDSMLLNLLQIVKKIKREDLI